MNPAIVLGSAAVALAGAASDYSQIHLSYTGVAGELAVDFVSTKATGQVRSSTTSPSGPWTTASTTSFEYKTIGQLHQAKLPAFNTTPGARVWYSVGDGTTWSDVYQTTPTPARGDQEQYAVFADFGFANDISMSYLVADAKAGLFDSVLHVGDWAYNFEDSNSKNGNDFMNLVQGYAVYKPVMPAAGNHERCDACPGIAELPLSEKNFTEYRARLHAVTLYAGANSGSNSNIYYSFNRGFTHFLVFSAEAYLYAVDKAFLANQVEFMKADLAAVDRSKTPWVVALVHKDWTMEAQAYADFAPVLENGGVDILFCGHVHYYNRYLPYDSVTGKTDDKAPNKDGSVYTNPAYMVTVVTGASGDHEGESKCTGAKPSFTCTENYGYGFFQALNASHATWNFKSVKGDGPGPADYKDSLTIVQANHGPRNGGLKW